MNESPFLQAGFSLARLHSLVRVDDAGGIAAAAPDDPSQQSQLSRNLSELEAVFGAELRRRKGRGIELTDAGKRLAELARSHLQALDDFADECRAEPLELRIGASQSALEWVFLPHVREIDWGDPPPRLVLKSLRSREVMQGLDDFSLDIGIVRKSAITSKRINTRKLASVRYALFVRKGMARRCGDDPLEVLRRIPLATSMGGEYRRRFDELSAEEGVVPEVRYACSSFRTALEALKKDPSLAALLPDSASEDLDANRFVALDLPFLRPYSRELVLAWHDRIEQIRPGAWEVIRRLIGK